MTIYSIADCGELTAHQADQCRRAFSYGVTSFEPEQGLTIVQVMLGGGFLIGAIVLYGWLLVDVLQRGDMSGRAKMGWLVGALLVPPVIVPLYLTQGPDVSAAKES